MKRLSIIFLNILVLSLLSCDKGFLEKKSNQKLLVPNTLEDFRLLLDNNKIMNITPGLGSISADDFVTTDAGFLDLQEIERSAYLWQMEQSTYLTSSDWNQAYEQVFYANVVLDGLKKLEDSEVNNEVNNMFNDVQGAALFYRAYAFFNLLQVYAEPYDPLRADQIKGIPIKLESDVNINAKVESLAVCYEQIIHDLILAEQLLPRFQQIKTRPSGNAALALLAKVSLIMQNFTDGEKYAQKALNEYAELIDYNTLDTNHSRPFPSDYPSGEGNKEVLFYSPFPNYWFLYYANREVIVNAELYDQYGENDLRKNLFFIDRGNGVINFKGSYSGARLSTAFSGLTTDEVYITLSECLARNNKISLAMDYLNRLLKTRYVHNTYTPLMANSAAEALQIILQERRKELVARGKRWSDLRRLNQEGILHTVLKKVVLGEEYVLDVKQSRYFYPFPSSEGIN